MPGPILKNDDQLIWTFDSPLTNVIGLPPQITGSGKPTVKSQKMCVESDLKNLENPKKPYQYTTALYNAVPGTVKLTILPNGGYLSGMATAGKIKILTIGNNQSFSINFKVISPAQRVNEIGSLEPETPPPTGYSGTLKFNSSLESESQHIKSN